MTGIWTGLLADLSVVAAVVLGWAQLAEIFKRSADWVRQVAFGLAMALGAVLAMSLPVQAGPGVLFDLRSAPLAVAGFFGGPVVALIAAVPALIYRELIGGSGTPAGCVAIVAAVAVASALQALAGTPHRERHILVLSPAVVLSGFAALFIVPQTGGTEALLARAVPAICVNLAAVLGAGLFMLKEERRRGLADSNDLYRAIIEALPDCLNAKDLAGRFLAANPATARLMGASSVSSLIGKTDFDFYPAETAASFRSDEVAIMEGERPVTIDQQASFPDGRMVLLSTLKAPFRNARGDVIGLITHNRDVTAARLVERDLQRTRQHLADALAHMADGIVMYDRDGGILICNDQYRLLFPATADLRVAGAKIGDVLRQSVARGEEKLAPGVDIDSWISAVQAEVRLPGTRIIELADGRSIEARTRPVADGCSLSLFSDVTARRLVEQDLKHKAEHDPLTGLPNRTAFENALALAHQRARLHGTDFAVMLIDLDQFKQINDKFGHAVGDKLLVEIGSRLEAACRQGDLVARLGGDEFAVVSQGETLEVGAVKLAQRIVESLARPFRTGNISLLPGASVGVSIYSRDQSEASLLLAHADEALYAAKGAGRRRWAVYDPGDDAALLRDVAS